MEKRKRECERERMAKGAEIIKMKEREEDKDSRKKDDRKEMDV